ncbi:MAG: hypothetical protein U9N46_05865 [Euryarchaeota archaeon]|nr:hypothetical protein [Euryarchaeota archaeon]
MKIPSIKMPQVLGQSQNDPSDGAQSKIEISKKNICILALIVIASTILGCAVSDRISQEDAPEPYVTPTPSESRASLFAALNATDEETSASAHAPTSGNQDQNRGIDGEMVARDGSKQDQQIGEFATEPAIPDCDFIWFDSKHASCYDVETDLWLVYEAGVGEGIFDNRIFYRHNRTDARWESFASQTPDDIWLIKRGETQSTSQLHLCQQDNTTGEWIEHVKQGSAIQLGSGRAWFDASGSDCHSMAQGISSEISIRDAYFSCRVSGGIPPVAYDWTSDQDGQIGSTGSFDRKLSKGTHRITLVVTDASGSSMTGVAVTQVD